MSWTLYESVTFDEARITSIDWQTYPDPALSTAVPERVDVHVIKPPPASRSWAAAKPVRAPAGRLDRKTRFGRRHRQAAARPAAGPRKADQGRDRRVKQAGPLPRGC